VDSLDFSRAALRRIAEKEPLDLGRAALAVAHEEYPSLDEAAYLRKLDDIAGQVMRSLPPGALPERRVGRLNLVLFRELGFRGNDVDYYDPRNSFLNEVLDRRVGIPITLSVVYLEVARRCGLAAEGVNFPGHFLCKVPLDEGELIVDPFHRGRLLGKDDLQKLLGSTSRDARLSARHLRPASGRDILARMLHNLRALYLERHDVPRALSAVERLLVLAPSDARTLRERADLYEQLGGSAAAAADLARVLELEPASKDAQMLRARLARLRGTPALLN
jgi:regulator of sirC expression with transglutaminase-like and TPR domain